MPVTAYGEKLMDAHTEANAYGLGDLVKHEFIFAVMAETQFEKWWFYKRAKRFSKNWIVESEVMGMAFKTNAVTVDRINEIASEPYETSIDIFTLGSTALDVVRGDLMQRLDAGMKLAGQLQAELGLEHPKCKAVVERWEEMLAVYKAVENRWQLVLRRENVAKAS